MPPRTRLNEAQVIALEHWVALGAPWPDEPSAAAAPEGSDSGCAATSTSTPAGTWWSFRPVDAPGAAGGRDAARRGPIDAFILAPLERRRGCGPTRSPTAAR